ncbi:MAG: efflux RND transporter periplasmic adaptor subunit, partial [Planctomycetota bacterium JB042]
RELKPVIFIRATVELDRVEVAIVVPFAALTERKGTTGVFLLDEDGRHVRWRPVRVGVKEAKRVQIVPVDGDPPSGRVVVLGQHLVDDGSEVVIPAEAGPGADGAASVE